MDPMSSPDLQLNDAEKEALLKLAGESIEYGFEHHHPLHPVMDSYSESLRQKRASFVTLQCAGRLCGCIGMLEARRPLCRDVAENAYAAAFEDPRFPPLTRAVFADIEIHISVLSEPEEISVATEEELLKAVTPGRDGLIIQEGCRRGTFLPCVWDQLPEPEQFVKHLKEKAGLPPGYWSDTLRVFRYKTLYIP